MKKIEFYDVVISDDKDFSNNESQTVKLENISKSELDFLFTIINRQNPPLSILITRVIQN